MHCCQFRLCHYVEGCTQQVERDFGGVERQHNSFALSSVRDRGNDCTTSPDRNRNCNDSNYDSQH